jgi:hypothetical protein
MPVGFLRNSWPRIPTDAALHIEEASIISTVSTVLGFDEKKFWIAIFSIMAKREAANANAIDQPFVPFVPSCGERHNSERISKRRMPPTQQYLSLNYEPATLAL